jgi:hypothetical protein
VTESAKPKCSAKRSDGEPCGKFPIRGGTVCPTHGGSAPAVRPKAAQRIEIAKFQRRYGGPNPPEISPQEAVTKELAFAAVHVEWLREQISGESGERWLGEYGRERDRLTRTAETAHKMGIAERQISLAEAMGATLTLLIARVCAELTPRAASVARAAFARELRALSSGDSA